MNIHFPLNSLRLHLESVPVSCARFVDGPRLCARSRCVRACPCAERVRAPASGLWEAPGVPPGTVSREGVASVLGPLRTRGRASTGSPRAQRGSAHRAPGPLSSPPCCPRLPSRTRVAVSLEAVLLVDLFCGGCFSGLTAMATEGAQPPSRVEPEPSRCSGLTGTQSFRSICSAGLSPRVGVQTDTCPTVRVCSPTRPTLISLPLDTQPDYIDATQAVIHCKGARPSPGCVCVRVCVWAPSRLGFRRCPHSPGRGLPPLGPLGCWLTFYSLRKHTQLASPVIKSCKIEFSHLFEEPLFQVSGRALS